MKFKKILKIVLAPLGLLLVLIVLTVLFWLGPTVKLIAQKVGTKALGTPLTINSLSINPRKGTISLSDFAIANPDTFGQSNAVSLAGLDVDIDIGSIFSQTVVVHQVSINSPHFIYEQSSASDNIHEFILSVQEFVGYDPAAPPDPKKEEKKRKKAEKKAEKNKDKEPKIVIVESLVINDVQFYLANTQDDQLDFAAGFGQLSVSMTNGTVQLDNLFISNPGRLETPNLFSLEQFELLLEPGGLYSSNLNINAVNIRKPHVFVEHNPEADTIGEFLKIASVLVAKIPTNAPNASVTNEVALAETKPEAATAPAKDVILGPVTIDDVQFHVVNIGDPDLSVHLGLHKLVVEPTEGRIQLDQLFFTNPKRLATPNLFSLDGISIDFDPDSLEAETMVFNDIQVKKPYAFLELNKEANTVTAFTEIANGFIERVPTYQIPAIYTPQAEPEASTEALTGPVAPTAPPIALHNLLVDDIQVKLLDSTSTNAVPTEPHMLAGIGEISIKLVDGELQINDIIIPNAEGFLATNLFHLAGIEIMLQPDSIFSDQVVIDNVFIDSLKVNLEQTEEIGNVVSLQNQLMQLAPPVTDESAEEPKQVAEASAAKEKTEPIPLSEQPVVLHQLIITNLAVNLKLPIASTNETSGLIGGTRDMLSPLNKLSLKKLNPLSSETDKEEVDPNAPMELLVFNQLSLEPLKGLLQIDGLRVSNPPNFSRRDLINIESFRIDLESDSLQTDTLIIQDILISRPQIRYERHVKIDNFKSLQQEIEQATVRREEALEEPPAEENIEVADTEEEGQKVIIEHLLVTDGVVRAKLSVAPSIKVPLPDIEMNDIGKEEGGASATEASTEVFDTFYESMIGAIGNATDFAGDAVKGVGSFGLGTLGGLTSGVTDGIGKVTRTAKDEEEEPEEEPAETPEEQEK